ncbi:hypothetical protein HMPREF9714_01694 [Myroides odoratimimus CCUG 12901]|nr:hypothetical protein HMPREF9714_01694 [Myroides odoratimimus CCUG 12901]
MYIVDKICVECIRPDLTNLVNQENHGFRQLFASFTDFLLYYKVAGGIFTNQIN